MPTCRRCYATGHSAANDYSGDLKPFLTEVLIENMQDYIRYPAYYRPVCGQSYVAETLLSWMWLGRDSLWLFTQAVPVPLSSDSPTLAARTYPHYCVSLD